MRVFYLSLFIIFNIAGFSQNNHFITSANSFSFNVFKTINSNDTEHSIIVSPLSVNLLVAQLFNGSSINTFSQIQETMGYEDNILLLNKNINYVVKNINSYQKGNTFNIANSIWFQYNYKFKKSYLTILDTVFYSYSYPVNFSNFYKRRKGVSRINSWADSVTNHKINRILEPSDVDNITKLILVNAVVFDAEWEYSFDKSKTTKQLFYTYKSSKKIPFMTLTNYFNFFQDDVNYVLELPYKDHKYSMIIILPKQKVNLQLLNNIFTEKYFLKATHGMKKERVNVTLPVFKTDYSQNMVQILIKMGIKDAFNNNADFSKMSSNKELYVDKLIHKAVIEVSESGTKATAVSSAVIKTKSATISKPPINFNANHPFIYFIRENKTGLILFAGTMIN